VAVLAGEAYVSVRYRDRWFWIDDRDVCSKMVFSFLMLAFSLTETGSAQAPPSSPSPRAEAASPGGTERTTQPRESSGPRVTSTTPARLSGEGWIMVQ